MIIIYEDYYIVYENKHINILRNVNIDLMRIFIKILVIPLLKNRYSHQNNLQQFRIRAICRKQLLVGSIVRGVRCKMYMTYLRQDGRREKEEKKKKKQKGARSPTFVVIITVTALRGGDTRSFKSLGITSARFSVR